MRNNKQDALGEKKIRMESWTLSQDAVEIKSLMAFRKKIRSLTEWPTAIEMWFWCSFWLRKFLHWCSWGDWNQKIVACMFCWLNASCLAETLLALLETKYWSRQTTHLSPYSYALGTAQLCTNTVWMGIKRTGKLSVTPTGRKQMFMTRFTPLTRINFGFSWQLWKKLLKL